MHEEQLPAALELVERRREAIEIEQVRSPDAGADELFAIPAGRKGEEASRRGSQIAHPVLVGRDELVALVLGELADAQGRLEGHESDVDPAAIEQRESALRDRALRGRSSAAPSPGSSSVVPRSRGGCVRRASASTSGAGQKC